MIAKAFKPVAWVAAVALPALGCYMLSLKVAAERADLANIEERILAARQDIRTLQTELGTRGRLQQLEQWNADVLALAAPVAGQFVAQNVSLARFDASAPALDPAAPLQMAAAEAPRVPNPVELAPRQASLERPAQVERQALVPEVRRAALVDERAVAAPRRAEPAQPLVRRASLITTEERPVRRTPATTESRATPAPRTERRQLVSTETERPLARRARAERD